MWKQVWKQVKTPLHSPTFFDRPSHVAKEYAARGAYAYVSMIQREERKNKVSAVPVRKGDQCGNINEQIRRWSHSYNHPEVVMVIGWL